MLWQGCTFDVMTGPAAGIMALSPMTLAINNGLRARELTRLRAMIVEHREILLEAWNAHFSDEV